MIKDIKQISDGAWIVNDLAIARVVDGRFFILNKEGKSLAKFDTFDEAVNFLGESPQITSSYNSGAYEKEIESLPRNTPRQAWKSKWQTLRKLRRSEKRKLTEDAPTNAMGASSSTSGPVQGYDPVLRSKRQAPKIRRHLLRRRVREFLKK